MVVFGFRMYELMKNAIILVLSLEKKYYYSYIHYRYILFKYTS